MKEGAYLVVIFEFSKCFSSASRQFIYRNFFREQGQLFVDVIS